MEFLENKVFCRTCGKKTNHLITTCHYESIKISNVHEFLITHAILKCAGCDTITYADIHHDPHVDEQGNQKDLRIIIFPEEPKVSMRVTTKGDIIYSSEIPKNISEIYKQLVASYNRKHNLLCAIGLRTLIEAICNELKIIKGFKYDENKNPLTQEGKKESIEGKINGLYEKEYIIWYQTLILQRIREIGNAATHELVEPTSEELYSAIEVVENLLENIYNLKNHNLLKK
ncbi:uncharacterized protein DUF4145 [Cytobacillus firmus]|uniref:Uncharacterized protein DUF4145 n=2 Tax=Cytobacillus TaxID=2675230 RepID=A0A366K0X7_CYTFI|nr:MULTISPECIES: DUF4145 domain-containing protein [Cytobacillus]RBP95385.1 uncharacterized protein DUF4145 [Cytobacillus firmus]TDX44226.1 uncharacterized protein DUF4145 [Cytobacillus oceanisediminis]